MIGRLRFNHSVKVNICHVIPSKIEEIDSAATADGEAKETLVHLVCSDWLGEKSQVLNMYVGLTFFLLSRNLELTWHLWALLPLYQHEATTGDTTWQKIVCGKVLYCKWFVGKSYFAKSEGVHIGVRLLKLDQCYNPIGHLKKKIFLVFFTFYSRNILYGDIRLDWFNYTNTKTHEWCAKVDAKRV